MYVNSFSMRSTWVISILLQQYLFRLSAFKASLGKGRETTVSLRPNARPRPSFRGKRGGARVAAVSRSRLATERFRRRHDPARARAPRQATGDLLLFLVSGCQQVQVEVPLVPNNLAAGEAPHWNDHGVPSMPRERPGAPVPTSACPSSARATLLEQSLPGGPLREIAQPPRKFQDAALQSWKARRLRWWPAEGGGGGARVAFGRRASRPPPLPYARGHRRRGRSV